MEQFRLPKIPIPAMELPRAVQDVLAEAEVKLAHRPKLLQLFKNCFPNTLATTTKRMEDGTTFIITGDIPAMWLRDSVEQVIHYVPLAKNDPDLQQLIAGLIKRHIQYIHIDPYANAFNESANDWHWNTTDETEMSPWVWERKFELDSICFSMRLAYKYWKETERTDIFDTNFKSAMRKTVDLWKTEQRHFELSPYRFTRNNDVPTDSLRNNGLGMPVNYTGMIWSGFRPSDDACDFHYNIPSNMFAVVTLRQMREMAEWVFRDLAFVDELKKLEADVDHGIQLYGIYRHPEFGPIYAYETDGFGNYCLMDDAGTPGLMSIPYIGYTTPDDPIYQNTRRFALSKQNPFYYEGKVAKGIGSPHTPPDYIWHMALSMQGLTAVTKEEKLEMLAMLEATDADTGFMHEGFHADDPTVFTRSWFAWSNSLFSLLVYEAMKEGIV
ncbi:glycoside hydrolase family 125 protein [Paenibacillus ehimensis]|uniref:Glycoside hydrolase family 125 protein n=1 Tax=Paenibacillus ehimensis TaxID=79264 RepID=A0ABT8VDJ6_9BACL|nr:glycoside hydrolase family 125 protein [Paenibacillus ehimensis]MDO3679035.1 glycoside hydrolase family 125 protein [Paenibacillus ehimensis]MEC0209994.1 glycoside hydrolase family 125 protein [Paenibacillus ehimensis]